MDKEYRSLKIPLSSLWKRILFYSLAGGLTVFLIAASLLHLRSSRLLDDARLRSRVQIDYLSGLIESYFQTVHSDLNFLPELNELIRYKSLPNEEDKIEIANEFREFCFSKGIYDQIRYLDGRGMELIRINLNAGSCRIVPDDELQNKSDRYYFREALTLNEGGIYVSPLDLNKEHGEIELPLKPMIRFSNPVWGESGQLKGMLILNYKASEFLVELEISTRSHPGEFGMLNEDGFWLHNEDSSQEWGFMFPEKEEAASLAQRKPELWATVLQEEEAQFIHDGSLCTTKKISPLNSSLDIKGRPHWILINQISCSDIGAAASQFWIPLIIIFLISLVFILPLSWLFALSQEQKKRYREALTHSAGHDSLTGLPNRSLLKARASHLEAEARRYHFNYALMFVDLDGFKSVNDTFGHDDGDLVLQEVARRLKASVRDSDTVSRTGGDEFIVLLHRINKNEDAGIVAQNILDSLGKPFPLHSGEVFVGASIGIALSSINRPLSFDVMLTQADDAMYKVKKSGKNNYAFIDHRQ